MNEVADDELVRQFQRGDSRALGILVDRHQDRLFRLACLWLADPSEARDVVQEVFSRSYGGFMRFRFRSQTSTWLVRVARNVCREFNRRKRGEPLSSEHEPSFEEDPGRDETIASVRKLVEHLPPRQKEVVALRYFEELSVADTAAAMACRPGTVKALLHKAMARLRELEQINHA